MKRVLLLVALLLPLGGCLSDDDGPRPSQDPASPTAEALPAMLVAGCENHNVYSQAPAPTARPLVPEEFTLATMGVVTQVQVALYFCDDLSLSDGTKVGPANWAFVQVRIIDVDPALAAAGITWYLVAGYTDSPILERLHRDAGLPLENATFAITRMPARWSFEVEVATASGPVFRSVQVSEATGNADGDEAHDHRSIRGSDGTYAWAEQNYTLERAYAATHTLVPIAGPVAELYGRAPNGIYSIPGAISDGAITFGRLG